MGRPPTGVGRGNGEGSKRTQYKRGAPSANPVGRPPKEKLPPATSIGEAMARELARTITIYENDVRRRMTQAEAMARLSLSNFPNFSPTEQLQALRYIAQHVPKIDPPAAPSKWNEKAVQKFVEELAKEAREQRSSEEGNRDPADD